MRAWNLSAAFACIVAVVLALCGVVSPPKLLACMIVITTLGHVLLSAYLPRSLPSCSRDVPGGFLVAVTGCVALAIAQQLNQPAGSVDHRHLDAMILWVLFTFGVHVYGARRSKCDDA